VGAIDLATHLPPMALVPIRLDAGQEYPFFELIVRSVQVHAAEGWGWSKRTEIQSHTTSFPTVIDSGSTHLILPWAVIYSVAEMMYVW